MKKINNIRENVKEFYGVELSNPENLFYYPLFEKYTKVIFQLLLYRFQ